MSARTFSPGARAYAPGQQVYKPDARPKLRRNWGLPRTKTATSYTALIRRPGNQAVAK